MRMLTMLLLTASLSAQTAKVIELSSADAAKAKSLHEAVLAAQKAEQDFRKVVEDNYLMESKPGSGTYSTFGWVGSGGITLCSANGSLAPCSEPTAEEKAEQAKAHAAWVEAEKRAHHLERRAGWFDFEYSEDFKFIVPMKVEPVVNGVHVCQSPCGWVTPEDCLVFKANTN